MMDCPNCFNQRTLENAYGEMVPCSSCRQTLPASPGSFERAVDMIVKKMTENFPPAERIAACVAAMDGIADPAAARIILDSPRTVFASDLLEAAVAVSDSMTWDNARDLFSAVEMLRVAIEKAQGK